MMKIRMLIALMALSLIGGLAAATAPTAGAVSTHAGIPARTSVAALPSGCSIIVADAVTWTVNANGIHIRSSPAGRDHYAIARNAGFVNDVLDHGAPVTCVNRHQDGNVRYWIYGYAHANHGHSGWIGCNYLNFNSTTTCSAYLRERGLN